MKRRIINQLKNREKGFTLVELMVAVALTGIIGLGASVSSIQVLTQTSRNNDFTTASRNAMNAIHWIGRDAQMAQVYAGVEGFPETTDLSLTWMEWDNTVNNASYTLDNGRLKRIYTRGGQAVETLIAEHINTDIALTNCVSDNGVLTVKITASVGEGAQTIDVTRVRGITSRPKL